MYLQKSLLQVAALLGGAGIWTWDTLCTAEAVPLQEVKRYWGKVTPDHSDFSDHPLILSRGRDFHSRAQ